MQLKSDPHIFSGMQRDLSISKQKAESLFTAKNLRFTARDGDTMLSITNEKGTSLLENLSMQGAYLGHCVINDYVVVFTHGDEDIIYKIYPDASQPEILYHGNLKFNTDFPIETLGVYENDNIQKVYWTDGINQPRVINVCDVKYNEDNDTQFDFVATLDLNESITVTRKDGSGTFAPGTIQYAFSYYNKYGRQSNIFYTTLLHYISYPDRGGSPEDKISNCFEINVKNLQMDFDYLRVYSIHRTSENAVPTVKRVIDIELSTVNGEETTFTDDGQIGDIIDPTELLYIGGEEIVAQTITQKDNTLFLGNLILNRDSLEEIKESIQSLVGNFTFSTVLKEWTIDNYDNDFGYYNYVPTLNHSLPGFKLREHYRLGIQFQHKSGKWSEPIFLKDYTLSDNGINPSITKEEHSSYSTLRIPSISCNLELSDSVYNKIVSKEYKRVRPICVFPTFYDRLVLTQGMLCPTVYNTDNRMHSTPFAQSSWFLRPTLPDVSMSDNTDYLSFYHLEKLKDSGNSAEIQGTGDAKDFYVDQSILTMHSPDIEWDDSFSSFDYSLYQLKIIGAIPFDKVVSAVDIQTSSPAFDNGLGFVDNHSKDTQLIASTLWHDNIITKTPDGKGVTTYSKKEGTLSNYFVYPWHRSGSLNNDEHRSNNTTQTAVLKQKKISNLHFSNNNVYFRGDHIFNYPLSKVQLFSSDQVDLVKIPSPHPSLGVPNITYYGNIDTMLNGEVIPVTSSGPVSGDNVILSTPAAIRMKYKSTKHLIFSLAYDNYRPVILPRLESNTERSGSTIRQTEMPWLDENSPTSLEIVDINLEVEHIDTTLDSQVNDGETIIEERTGRVLIVSKREALNTQGYIVNYDAYPYGTIGKLFKIVGTDTYYIGTSTQGVVTPYADSASEINIYDVQQKVVYNETVEHPFLFLGELVRNANEDTDFGGNTKEAIKNNLWLPAGEPVEISKNISIKYIEGDTWYTRYDCLKTYPFTQEDENQIVEIGSFLCESRINGDGRYDRNRGQISNLNMSPVNFNLLNPVYNNKDNFFNYRVLDEDYYTLNKFSNQITWSKEKQNAADIDLWTNITMANTFDLDGTMGEISALRTWRDTIYCFQDNAISIISFNPRVQIPTSDGVPIEISNSYKLEGKVYISDSIGCSNKQTIAVTPSGIYFIDPNSKELYNLAGNQLTSVSTSHGFSNWFKSNELTKSFYDKNRNDLYVSNADDCIAYSEVLGQFTSFMDYNGLDAMFNIHDRFFALRGNSSNTSLYSLFTGQYNYFFDSFRDYWFEFISNADSSMDKIFSTIEMRVDFRDSNSDVLHNEFFSGIQVDNEYQDTLEQSPDAIKKFRVWRTQIPRDYERHLDRIRNTWAKIKFTKRNTSDVKMELHDLNVQYFI